MRGVSEGLLWLRKLELMGEGTLHTCTKGRPSGHLPLVERKFMGRLKSSTEIPKDAIPEIHVPSFIESFFGGPVVAKQKFLPADRMVSSLQIGAASSLTILCFLTLAITPVSGTAWFAVSNILGLGSLGGLFHLSLIIIGLIGGIYGTFQRDKRAMLVSYVSLILVTVRFAGSTVDFRFDFSPRGRNCSEIYSYSVRSFPSYVHRAIEWSHKILDARYFN